MPRWKKLVLTLINVWVEIPFTWIEPIRFKGPREFPQRSWKSFDFTAEDGGLVSITIDPKELSFVEEHTSMHYFGRRRPRRAPIKVMRTWTFALVAPLVPVLAFLWFSQRRQEQKTRLHRQHLGVWEMLEPHLSGDEERRLWRMAFLHESRLLANSRFTIGYDDARSYLRTVDVAVERDEEGASILWFDSDGFLIAEAYFVDETLALLEIGADEYTGDDALWLVRNALRRDDIAFEPDELAILRELGLRT
jgi:hypothetical protein